MIVPISTNFERGANIFAPTKTMDRIEAFYKKNIAPAQEAVSAGTVVGGAIVALIAASVAKAKIKGKIRKSRIAKYDKESAAGNISEKTLTNANKIIQYGMKYPEYAETVKWYKRFTPQVMDLIKKYQGAIKDDLTKLTSSGSFNDYPSITHFYSMEDAGYSEHQYLPFSEIILCAALSYEDIAECMDTEDEDIADAIRYVASDNDISAIKHLSLKQLQLYLNAVDRAILRHIVKFANDLKKLGILVTDTNIDDNPDDVYKEYGVNIKFSNHANS